MDGLERDLSQVLRLVRSLKNLTAPVNRIPPEVLSLIPDYSDYGQAHQDLIALTHVCRRWRDILISRPSLWTLLEFLDVDRTRTYIERSRTSPLDIFLEQEYGRTYLDDAFSLVIPHVNWVKILQICTDFLPDALQHFRCRTPLLESLHIEIIDPHSPVLDSMLFNGDLSSLRALSLYRVTTLLPWNNLANLTFLYLESCTSRDDFATRLLDLFDSAPLLEKLTLINSTPKSSGVPPRRMVPPPRLRKFIITARPAPSIILNHLFIPTGASLTLEFSFRGGEPPFFGYLQNTSPNLGNLAHITTVNLCFGDLKCARLSGPSVGIHLYARWEHRGDVSSYTMDRLILRSLGTPILPTTQRLAISKYKHSRPAECQVFRTLSSAPNLRALTLTECNTLPFIHALDPEKYPHELVLCPKLEELVFYTNPQHLMHFRTQDLIIMTKNRASKRAKLWSTIIVGLDELEHGGEALKLREHVTHVEYRPDDRFPAWGYLPGESIDGSE